MKTLIPSKILDGFLSDLKEHNKAYRPIAFRAVLLNLLELVKEKQQQNKNEMKDKKIVPLGGRD